jgi:hypothetical protein
MKPGWGGWRRALAQMAPFALLLLFWGVSVVNLGRYPLVEEDEPWILSPGYKLFTQGIYGSDLFRGFHGMDQHNFEFMPLMAWLEGAATRLMGVGVLQLRWVPVALGALTLALTFALARRLIRPGPVGRGAGLAAMGLLLCWQWTAGRQALLGSGIPLIDIARIARYDILVPPLGLAAIWAAWHAQQTGRTRFDLLAGVLGGLAGLAHIYGLFWLMAAVLLRLAGEVFSPQPEGIGHPPSLKLKFSGALRLVGAVGAGLALAWGGWVAYLLPHWAEFVAQTAQYSDRFGVLDPAFYLINVREEPHRYFLGLRDPAVLGRPGFWLLVAGVPLAWLALGVVARRQRQRGLAWLWFLSAFFPALLAVLIRTKTFTYLISVAPLWALVLAGALAWLYRWRPAGRWVVAGALGVVMVQGGLSLAWMQTYANRAEPLNRLYAGLQRAVPPGSRVLGPGRYWLALTGCDYRSLVLPFFISNGQYTASPVSFDQAMDALAPQIVLVDLYSDEYQNNYAPRPLRHKRNLVRAYLDRHRARLLQTLPDNFGQPVEVYQLDSGYNQANPFGRRDPQGMVKDPP